MQSSNALERYVSPLRARSAWDKPTIGLMHTLATMMVGLAPLLASRSAEPLWHSL